MPGFFATKKDVFVCSPMGFPWLSWGKTRDFLFPTWDLRHPSGACTPGVDPLACGHRSAANLPFCDRWTGESSGAKCGEIWSIRWNIGEDVGSIDLGNYWKCITNILDTGKYFREHHWTGMWIFNIWEIYPGRIGDEYWKTMAKWTSPGCLDHVENSRWCSKDCNEGGSKNHPWDSPW